MISDVRAKVRMRMNERVAGLNRAARVDSRMLMLREDRIAAGIDDREIRDYYRGRLRNAAPGCELQWGLYYVDVTLPDSYPNAKQPIRIKIPRDLFRALFFGMVSGQ